MKNIEKLFLETQCELCICKEYCDNVKDIYAPCKDVFFHWCNLEVDDRAEHFCMVDKHANG